ncbi:phosphatase PAP2 family protein [Halostagnicola kamekurae]|uniref:Membrane-associated phospholipid phosphatase n=1 Tax=Halostagnicola kamekurae TaxID=619731 RepID=A0A1I6U472_9EURY|nr:phosphatase PAP2 family protein [Halostagnicola kamekurae]SFS96201.1 Membrane-associated phospholipid phosphatase [Halostagnicola kamekurae]
MLAELVAQVLIVVSLMLAVFTTVCVGRERLRRTRREWPDRLRQSAPVVVIVIAVLLLNRIARPRIPPLSRAIDWNLTPLFYNIEGETVLWFQSFATPALTQYLSFVYIYGYAFMLIFPVIAYFALSDTRPFRELLSAYALNYVLGLILYLFVLAYGPRNLMPDAIGTALYQFNPQYMTLTSEVNHKTNVFPSLHTSLSATIALFAYRTRESYPIWFLVSVPLAVSVAVSTMYLGMHWAIDVVFGIILAIVTVKAADRFVGRWSLEEDFGIDLEAYENRLRSALGREKNSDDSGASTDQNQAMNTRTDTPSDTPHRDTTSNLEPQSHPDSGGKNGESD